MGELMKEGESVLHEEEEEDTEAEDEEPDW